MSKLRKYLTPRDRRIYRLLNFVAEYWDCPLKFLTLTYPDGGKASKRDLFLLKRKLLKISHFEYLAVRTDEHNGCGVYHLCVLSDYIDFALLQETWESITGAWGVNIQQVKKMHAFFNEMTRQELTVRYSQSRGLVPKGTERALNRIQRDFTGILRKKAYRMLAVRCRQNGGDVDRALHETLTCIGRSPLGSASDIITRNMFNTHWRYETDVAWHGGRS